MDLCNFQAMKFFLQFLRENGSILKVLVAKKIDQLTMIELQNMVEADPSFHTIWIVPSENDDGIVVLRVDRGGDAPYSLATEGKLKELHLLKNTLDRVEKVDPSNSHTQQHLLSVLTASWTCWIRERSPCSGDVPPNCRYDDAATQKRFRLQIVHQFNEILQALSTNVPSFIVCGSPDSGKRTEIVHYIVQNCHRKGEPCRMICVLQEEVEVVTSAVRIAMERNEQAGSTVGYKLNINSNVSEMNNVVFCTIHTLLLTLLTDVGRSIFAQLTHLVVDNVDRSSCEMSLLLSLLKEKQMLMPTFKLVLLATSDKVSTVCKFFGEPQVLRVPHNPPMVRFLPNNPHGVEYHYLEDILDDISTHEMIRKLKDQLQATTNSLKLMAKLQVYYGHFKLNRNATRIMDPLLERCWYASDAKPFTDLMALLKYNQHLVDYQHTETRMSSLMIASAKGFLEVVEKLLAMGANPYIVGRKSLNALDWCAKRQENPCWHLMDNAHRQPSSNSTKQKLLCQLYRKTHSPYIVDQQLVVDVVTHICKRCVPGKILVMLPDFTHVLQCYELLQKSLFSELHGAEFLIYHRLLTEQEVKASIADIKHNSLYMVILMAGSLIELVSWLGCIDYVVDTGLNVHTDGGDHFADGLCIDGSCMVSSETVRILKMIAQRKCYMLYPRERSEEQSTKEVGLNEDPHPDGVLKALMCRYQSSCSSVEIFFDSALAPANPKNITDSLDLLDQIGAIRRSLNIPTDLGLLLMHLNLGVHLGKALLYSILCRCLDPVLTIVAAMKIGDPFVETLDVQDESNLKQKKYSLHNRTYSDMMVLLRLFQQWNQCKIHKTDREMVESSYLKAGYMEAVVNTRVEIMSELRVLGIIKCGRTQNTEDLNVNSNRWVLVKGCLAAGLYPQLAIADYENKQLTANCGKDVFVPHPLSVAQVENLPAKWVVYVRKQDYPTILQMDEVEPKSQISENTVISDWTVLLMCGVDRTGAEDNGGLELRKQPTASSSEREMVEMMVDRKYSFRLPLEYYRVVSWIRRKLGNLFRSFTSNPLNTLERKETGALVRYIGEILHLEDANLQLGNMVIDTRPKLKITLPMGIYWSYSTNFNFGHTQHHQDSKGESNSSK
uniref:Helicase-associated domain-containing protein n=1 Tax=Anopheles epiroticus TaxID=199890 RepID=A0A182PMM1_9DIPT